MKYRIAAVAALALAVCLVAPSLALGAAVPSPHLALPSSQLWVLLIGSLVPLVGYLLNHYAPWIAEPVKAIVLLVLSAAASAIYTAVATNVIGWNSATFQLVLSAVLAALAAHKLLWQPSGISAVLGGGTNYPEPRAAVGPVVAPRTRRSG